jgi:mono/diheme cytochrome c family protein
MKRVSKRTIGLRLPVALTWSIAISTAILLVPTAGNSADLEAGRKTFETVCAVCHGATGKADPASPTVQALDTVPADLSDPLFNSREPGDDWHIVVEHGGQALGLSSMMPAQGGALTDEEIRNVVAYAKTLAPGSELYPPGEMNFFLPVRTKKAFPEDEIVWKSRVTDREGDNVWRNVIEFEKRFGRRSMGLLEVAHEDDGTDSEITEVQVGVKTVLHWSLADRSILSGALVLALPTDNDESEAIIPYFAYARQFSESMVFQSSARAILPFDDTSDDGSVELAGVVHYLWSERPRSAFPGLELTAAIPFDDHGGDSVQWTVVPQLRFGLTRGGHVALNLGVEVPLNDQSWDTRYHLNLLWDFADGSFFKGW